MNAGKNRGLGGLAAGIVKLWEKSEIVKIGVKRGVQNTSNERMAEELKVRFTFKLASLSCHVRQEILDVTLFLM